MNRSSPKGDLSELRRRLDEAEETLRAIRSGEVDALVVNVGEVEQVFTLQSADHPYRCLIESMHQGAVSLSTDGTVLYCNRCFAEMVKTPHEKVVGADVAQFLPLSLRGSFKSLLEQTSGPREMQFQAADGKLLPVYIAITPLSLGETSALCMVVTDLTQQKHNQELQDANRRKDEFLAMLAHELRNPLAPIQNAVAILQQLGIEDPRLAYIREVIERQVRHMSHLVDDLLDVSRITMGKVKLQKGVVELSTIVMRAVEATRPILDARRQQLTIALTPNCVKVEVDATRLTQVIGNLLTNAAKYTDEGGEIELTMEGVESEAVIRIKDNGMGISAELLPHVFDLFTQGDRSLARSEGGLGIGLTLVRRLVELHDGSVEAHSEGPGHGSEFVVRLPTMIEPPAPQENPLPTPHVSHPSSRLRILVVEDNKDGANSLGLLLRFLGHEVRITYSGMDAVPAALDFRPDVVLLDIGLPGMNGYEVARKLRGFPEFDKTTLVAMTGYGQDEDRQNSSAAGFGHHLVKPVATDCLRELLKSIEPPRS